ncbi:MAG TPA: type II toxin-antitoxin system Phd/YefM family antitoxin [Actinomycetota bacterium]|nr:type II toxin-antitoxin system Phd/YefM family antitoxin [Actinomycetota bacterium]
MERARIVAATDFKQHCLALLDDVSRSGRAIVVTKHGRPVARLVPVEDRSASAFFGSVTLVSDRPEDYYSAGDAWETEDH